MSEDRDFRQARLRDITIAQLRLAIDVAQTASFSEAARLANLTQPAVSRAIRQLERSVGAPIFARTTRTVRLTPEGQEFLEVAKRIVTEYDNGMGRFVSYQDGRRGQLTVAALPSLAAGFLAGYVAGSALERPEVRLTLITGNSEHLLAAIRNGEADLAITDSAGMPSPDLEIRKLFNDEMIVLASPTHALSGRATLTWTDLVSAPFIMLQHGTSVRALAEIGFAACGARPQDIITTDAIASAASLVSKGAGVTAVPQSVLALVSNAELAKIPLTNPEVSREIAIIARTEPRMSPAAAAFAASVCERIPSGRQAGAPR